MGPDRSLLLRLLLAGFLGLLLLFVVIRLLLLHSVLVLVVLFLLVVALLTLLFGLLHQEEVTRLLLVLILLGFLLVDPGSVVSGIASKGDVHELEELVHAGDHRFGRRAPGILGRLAVKENDLVSQVSSHNEIVLDNESSAFSLHDPAFHNAGGDHSLLGVEVSGRLVDQIDITGLGKTEHDSDALKFTTGEVLHLLVEQGRDVKGHQDLSLEDGGLPRALELGHEEGLDVTFELGSDSLRLVRDVETGHLVSIAVRLQNTRKHLDHRGLACSVLTKHDNYL